MAVAVVGLMVSCQSLLARCDGSHLGPSVAFADTMDASSGREPTVKVTAETVASFPPAVFHVDVSKRRGPGSFRIGGNLWPSAALPRPVKSANMSLLRLWGMPDSSIDYPINATRGEMTHLLNKTLGMHDLGLQLKSFVTDARASGVQVRRQPRASNRLA